MPSIMHKKNCGIVELPYEDFCDLVEDSELVESLNLGPTILHLARHVEYGSLVLVSTTHGQAAVIAV